MASQSTLFGKYKYVHGKERLHNMLTAEIQQLLRSVFEKAPPKALGSHLVAEIGQGWENDGTDVPILPHPEGRL
jgi:hypothetical protein